MRKALLVLVAGLALGSLLWIAREWYRSYRVHSGHQFVVVEPGMRAPAVARVLVAHGVLAYRAAASRPANISLTGRSVLSTFTENSFGVRFIFIRWSFQKVRTASTWREFLTSNLGSARESF